MKHVNVTAADIEKLKKALPTAKLPTPALHHEEMIIDGVGIGLSRPAGSEDPRTNTHAFAFRSGDSDYLIIVRPTVHGVPSVTLNITRKEKGTAAAAQFASYTVLKDTVTTLKGQILGEPITPSEGTSAEAALAKFDFHELLERFKMQ
jgi:hypothetical protein